MAKWHWRYRSRSKVVTRDTLTFASDHLCQTWKESIQNCPCFRADTARCVIFQQFYCKSWLNDSEGIAQGQRSLCATHPLMLVVIYAKYGKNTFERTDRRADGYKDEHTDKQIARLFPIYHHHPTDRITGVKKCMRTLLVYGFLQMFTKEDVLMKYGILSCRTVRLMA